MRKQGRGEFIGLGRIYDFSASCIVGGTHEDEHGTRLRSWTFFIYEDIEYGMRNAFLDG